MSISWTAPTSNGGASITGYTVIDGSSNVVCTSVNTSCTETGLTVGNTYTFRVYATNVAGNGPNSTASLSVQQLGPPNTPQNIKALSGRYRFLVDWTAPVDNNLPISSYTATASFGASTYTCTTTTATRCIISGLPSGQRSYNVVVTATNVHGTSTASTPVSWISRFTPQDPPASDLTDFDLSGLDLSYVNLSNANLSNINFGSANLTGAIIKNSNLTGANLSGATLNGLITMNITGTPTLPSGYAVRSGYIAGPNVNLFNMNLEGVNLSSMNLSGAHFGNSSSNGSFTSANFTGSILSNANFSGADLEGANLTRAALNGANFSNANMRTANLQSANLQGANLSTANLTGATLIGVRSGSISGNPIPPSGWVVANGYLVGSRAYLTGANLENANLQGVNLSSANLLNANLSGANLQNTNLTGTNLRERLLRFFGGHPLNPPSRVCCE